ncbi:carbohydrate ABC transporter permease [Bacillus sp. N9]
MMVGFLLVMLFPLVYSIYMSLTDWQLLGDPNFIGTANYQQMVNDPEFFIVLKNTFLFSAGLVPINIILALWLAMLLQRNLPGMGLFRTAIFIPVMTSIVVWSIIWKYMFGTDEGFINQVLGVFGIEGPAWLYNPNLAMGAVIFVSAIKNVGLNMVLFLAALQQVDKNLYEASYLDGANKWNCFWHITLPMITPTIFLTIILTVIGSMKVFGQIYVMTNGGPEITRKYSSTIFGKVRLSSMSLGTPLQLRLSYLSLYYFSLWSSGGAEKGGCFMNNKINNGLISRISFMEF